MLGTPKVQFLDANASYALKTRTKGAHHSPTTHPRQNRAVPSAQNVSINWRNRASLITLKLPVKKLALWLEFAKGLTRAAPNLSEAARRLGRGNGQ